MTTNENGTPQLNRYPRRRPDGSFGIIILACLVFFFVNGPSSDASNNSRFTGDPTFSGAAILSGIERTNNSKAFRSAEATAFMGGVNLDLREAVMEGNEATIDVTAIMGGVEIRVPREWTVVNRVTPVMGGVQDRTRSSEDSNKRVVFEGTVVMGGLEIKN